jgi:serine/threonine-protein kinase
MKKIGRYDIVEELGRGAMGVVYKASDPTIGRLVAIKVLSLGASTEPGVPGPQDIFMREARAAGRLSHPGIVTIHDALEDPETQSCYIVMEFVSGRTLESLLLSGPPLETQQSLNIIRQVAEALDYAHRQHVIHRDLKPANILLAEDGRAKLTDFGIAKIMALEGAQRTAAIMGTPSYMSPEQVTGGQVDARSDLFSLGIILYQMLAGQKPFPGDTAAVMFKIAYEDPVPPSKINPQLSIAHDYLVLRSLAKSRDKRYASAREFLDDLEDVQHSRPPRSEAKVPLAELSAGERTMMAARPFITPPAEKATAAGEKFGRVVPIAGAVALLAVLLGTGVWVYRRVWRLPAPPEAPRIARTAPSLETLASTPSATEAVKPPPGSPPQRGTTASPKVEGGEAGAGIKRQPARKPPALSSQPAQAGPTQAAAPLAAPPAVKPAATPTPGSQPTATTSATPGKVQLWCKHELKEGKLTVSSGTQVLFEASLKGKKKGGFLGIKGGFGGLTSHPITIPSGKHDLTVHVVSADGTLDLSKTISATPPAGSAPTLQVLVGRDKLTLHWGEPGRPAP